MKKYLVLISVALTLLLLSFQNCSGDIKALSQRQSIDEEATFPSDDPSGEDGLGEDNGPDLNGILPKVGVLLFENQFSSEAELNSDFDIMESSPDWDAATRARQGQNTLRDPIYEEGHYSSPADALLLTNNGNVSSLEIQSMPAISQSSGMGPEECNAAIMGLRNWSFNGAMVRKVDENANRHFSFPNDQFGGKISAGSPQQGQDYWDALDECRIYTGLLTSKKKWGPGTRIQVRFRASEVIRTGNIFLMRLLSPGSYSDESTATGLDMSILEIGAGKERNDPNFGGTRQWFNTAIRSSTNRISYFVDSTPASSGANYTNLAGFYEWQNTWNSYFTNWYEDQNGRKALTQISTELPSEISGAGGIFADWYVLTMDWKSDKIDIYLQKRSVDGEPFHYFSTTDANLISQSCDQQLKIGNVISQTFAETEISIWYHVQAGDLNPAVKSIVSPQFPQGRNYNTYAKDVFEVDWVRVFDIPGGQGNTACVRE